jgi:hypothetical protein
VVWVGGGAGGEMTQALYAYMNNKNKFSLKIEHLDLWKSFQVWYQDHKISDTIYLVVYITHSIFVFKSPIIALDFIYVSAN